MAKDEGVKVRTLSEALALLGSAVTFREESHERAFAEYVASVAEGEDTEPEELGDLTKAELLARAEAAGLDVSANDTKAELQAAIEAAEENGGSS
jgi:NAD(P)H-dependent FMN reductase